MAVSFNNLEDFFNFGRINMEYYITNWRSALLPKFRVFVGIFKIFPILLDEFTLKYSKFG